MAYIPASDAQMGFVNTLMSERDWSGLNVTNIEARLDSLSKTDASTLISLLMGCPRKAAGATVKAEEGFYLYEGDVYRVQRAKSTGNPYAKILVPDTFGSASWAYAPGAIKKLADAPKLTLEAASEMGHHYGVCMVCGRTLTAEESVQAGIGPICANRL